MEKFTLISKDGQVTIEAENVWIAVEQYKYDYQGSRKRETLKIKCGSEWNGGKMAVDHNIETQRARMERMQRMIKAGEQISHSLPPSYWEDRAKEEASEPENPYIASILAGQGGLLLPWQR